MLIEVLLAVLAAPCVPSAPAAAVPDAAPPDAAAPALLAQSADDLVASGRAHLEAGRLPEARADLERAAALDDSFDTTMWLLRLEVAEGATDEVLGKVSRLRREGQRGPALDYLAGVALAARAEAEIASGGGGSTGLLLQDAEAKLAAALAADPERFGDAWLHHARVARNLGDSATSLESARAAAARDPRSVEAFELVGRAAVALFAARAGEDPRPDEVAALRDEAAAALNRAVELAGEPDDYAGQSRLASVWNQLGTLHAWDGELEAARAAWGEALGWDPNVVDIGGIRGSLGEHFVPALEYGIERFAERFGERDARDATVQWWLGWALYAAGDRERLDDAADAFETAVKKWPPFVNSWYWLARIRYDQQDYGAAIAALRENWMAGRDDLVASVAATPLDSDRIEYMVGWSAGRGGNDDAAFLSEILVAVHPETARFWNNLGLFLRDLWAVIAAELDEDDVEGRAEVLAGWERSYDAYMRALELEQDNPAYLNDGAVLLHYYLERDYDEALAMYARARELAEQQLAGGALPADERPIIEIALRDAKDNRRKLERKIAAEREAAEAEREAPTDG